ncbi:MAG: 3-keto-5-aminohexanoate cleavage protein [Ignavibacteria bacterium]|nr:3-keto-5-aminohexanoate cleavage protein [Ignavibacteria bacterium]MDP3829691.1 3-keto-5-aminohexanoate cleavage protein [Ignavibacteriaceae bacterium]
MFIKIALNGARPKEQNKYLPHSLAEIEKEVDLLYNYGCKVFHIHCYDKNGNESLKPNDVNNLVLLVKNISPEIQIGISSGDWIEPDLEKRKGYIKSWKNIPDFISVNMIEDDSIEISKLLISKGVKIEAGLNEKKAAEIFVKSNLEKDCCRILIEPEPEELYSAIQVIIEIEKVLDASDVKISRLLHGFNSVSWDILREAKRRGYDSRMGMEDTIYLENGEMVKSNLELIQCANKILTAI